MSDWQSIETAPEGVVVLTNKGTAIYVDRWLLCQYNGEVPCCASYGFEVSEISPPPTHWMPPPSPPSDQ